jgi:hypothetical protein
MEVKTMCSEKQTEANRLNAQKSTGPKTPDGKAKVSQNAITHGLCSTRPVLSTENPEQYDQFRDDFFRRYAPEGALENVLAERAVNTFWRLQRAQNFETLVTNNFLNEAWHVSNGIGGAPDSLLLAVVIEHDFSKEQTLERIQRYELRIENSHYRTLRELRKLQSQRLNQAAEANTQNKANSPDIASKSKIEILSPRDRRSSIHPQGIVNPLPLSNSPEMNTLAPDVLKTLMKNNPRLPKMLTMAM